MVRLLLRQVARSAHCWAKPPAVSLINTSTKNNLTTCPRNVTVHKFQLLASRGYSTSPSSVLDLAKTLTTDQASTRERIDAINELDLSSSLDENVRQQHVLDIVDSNALRTLLSVVQANDAIDLVVPAFLALIRLSKEPLLAQQLLSMDASAVLVAFLTQSDPRFQAAACLTLGNLALEPKAAQAVSSPAVVSAVLRLLKSPHDPIKRAATTCVANIASSAQGRREVIQKNGMFLVGELLNDEYKDPVRSAAAFALGNILSGRDIDAQDVLHRSGALSALVLMLPPIYAEDVNSSAAWALYHGVHLSLANQSLVAEAGGLAMLVHHVATGASESLQTNALLALESAVTLNDKNLHWCRTNNVRQGLQHVQAMEKDTLNANAKHALNSLLDQLT